MSDVISSPPDRDLEDLLHIVAGKSSDDPIFASQEFVQKHPERGEGYFILGVLTYVLGHIGDAMQMFELAYEKDPDVREYAQALASIYAMSDRLSDALYYGKLGVVLDSREELRGFLPPELRNFVEAAGTLDLHDAYVKALLAFNRREFGSALDMCADELKQAPSFLPAKELRAKCLVELGDFVGAIPVLQDLLQLNPAEEVSYRGDLAQALCHLGLFASAREHLEAALRVEMASIDTAVKAVSMLPLLPDPEPLQALAWEVFEKEGVGLREPDFPLEPFENEKTHVGFLTDKCYDCFEGNALSALVSRFDKARFEVYVYIQNINQDYVTQEIKNRAKVGREVYEINDKTLSLVFQRDAIDVVVDMCGFGPNQRLSFIGSHPGGMRVNWLAPFCGQAQPAVERVMAEKSTQSSYASGLGPDQELLMIDGPLFARGPLKGYLDPVNPPVLTNGHVTFGVHLDFRSFESGDAQVWARLLGAVPGAKLKINVGAQVSEFILLRLNEIFEPLGLVERVELHSPNERDRLGAFYDGVDIVLAGRFDDAIDFIEAMWMGAPCLTYRREGGGAVPLDAAVLRAAGIPSWVCETEDDFVAFASGLANDTRELTGLRTALRPQLAQSALMNTDNFAIQFQAALHTLRQAVSQPG